MPLEPGSVATFSNSPDEEPPIPTKQEDRNLPAVPGNTPPPPPAQSPSSVTVNLGSIDAYFATILARIESMRDDWSDFKGETRAHLRRQDDVLQEIKSDQNVITGKAHTALEATRKLETRVDDEGTKREKLTDKVEELYQWRKEIRYRTAGFIMAISLVGAALAWVLTNFLLPWLSNKK